MERKVGEVFYSELLQCYLKVEKETCCCGCAYYNTPYCSINNNPANESLRIAESGWCSSYRRHYSLRVIFKKFDVSSEFDEFCLEVKSIGLEKEEENALIEFMRKAKEERGN